MLQSLQNVGTKWKLAESFKNLVQIDSNFRHIKSDNVLVSSEKVKKN
jgi:hypothetical protein